MNHVRSAVPLRLLFFDTIDGCFNPLNKGLRLGQCALRELELSDQYTVFIDNNQAISLLHNDSPS